MNFNRIKEGDTYIFRAIQKYAKQFDGKEVKVLVSGEIYSKCMTDEGQTFAAMNDELNKFIPKEEDELERNYSDWYAQNHAPR